jgi:ribokinase
MDRMLEARSKVPLFVLGSFMQALCWRVPRLPGRGESLMADAFNREPGGKGFNLAVGAHRLGADVRVLLAVGADAGGDWAMRLLREEGLSTEHVQRLSAPTGEGAGFIDPQGDNMIVVHPGANAQLDARHVEQAASAIATAQLVCAQFECPDAPIIAAFTLAHRHRIPTLLNAAPYRTLSPELLASTDTLVLNAREAEHFLGVASGAMDSVDTARARLIQASHQGSTCLVVTLGALGCVARASDGQILHQPAFAVETVDSVGAGDAFCAGLAVGLAEGLPLAEGLTLGTACGALVCAQDGVLQALPDATTLKQFLQSRAPVATSS